MASASLPSGSSKDKPNKHTDTDDEPQPFWGASHSFDHELMEIATTTLRRRVTIEEDGARTCIRRGSRRDSNKIEIESVECTCGKEFSTLEKGEEHLEREWEKKFGFPGLPDESPTGENRTPVYAEETVISHLATVRPVTNVKYDTALGRVEDGLNALLAQARREYYLPADYDFEDWECLQSGRLRHPSGGYRIDSSLLQAAISALSPHSDNSYDPDALSLYDLGADFLLTGYGDAFVISHKTCTYGGNHHSKEVELRRATTVFLEKQPKITPGTKWRVIGEMRRLQEEADDEETASLTFVADVFQRFKREVANLNPHEIENIRVSEFC